MRDLEAARVRRCHDDVGFGERRGNFPQGQRLGLEPPRDPSPPLLAPIRNESDPRPASDQPPGRRLSDLAGADQQHLPIGQIAEHALGEHGRSGSRGGSGISNLSLRAHLAADP